MNTDNQNQNNSFENGGNINPNYQDPNINNQYNDYQNNNNNYNNPNMNPNPNEGQNINNNMYNGQSGENVIRTSVEQIKVDTLNKKTRFKYTVVNEKGKKEVGYLDAYNQNEVEGYLLNSGLKITKIEAQNSILSLQIGGSKLNSSELAFMLTQLSTYLKAGIPLIDSIRILEKQSKSDKKRIYSNLIY